MLYTVAQINDCAMCSRVISGLCPSSQTLILLQIFQNLTNCFICWMDLHSLLHPAGLFLKETKQNKANWEQSLRKMQLKRKMVIRKLHFL